MDELLNKLSEYLTIHKEIYQKLGIDEGKLIIFDKLNRVVEKIKLQISRDIDNSYLKLYENQISQITGYLPFKSYTDSNFVEPQDIEWKKMQKDSFNNYYDTLGLLIGSIDFQIDFFNKIGDLNSNIVLIGANGSGKTSLADKLKSYLNNNGIVISAQRILNLPNIETIGNPEITANELRIDQQRSKTYKNKDHFRYLNNEFEIVIKHLLANNNVENFKFKKKLIETLNKGEIAAPPQKTKLEITFEIWNSLIEHRYIGSEDGINIKTYTKDTKLSYPSIQMSEGEKVLLYLIAQTLLAPQDGFIVIDEPEMYLHKTIVKKLWDVLEVTRPDCLFIYLTHDLDFATSRNIAKKIWIKSYNHPTYWEIENIESDEIPEALLFELLGSRKNILFCEGIRGSNDEKIYSLLFPNFTIIPVGSCFNVINHTKAFNKISNTTTKAVGLIDSDHHSSERLQKIKEEGVFNFAVSEIENLFLDEEFLKCLAENILADKSKVYHIKEDIIKELEKEKDLQISNYISAKINNIFTDTDLSKGNTLEKVEENYSAFLSAIDIKKFYQERKTQIEKIITEKDYKSTISIFNNKGLKKIPSRHFDISDFTNRSFKLIQSKPEALELLKKYFPPELFI